MVVIEEYLGSWIVRFSKTALYAMARGSRQSNNNRSRTEPRADNPRTGMLYALMETRAKTSAWVATYEIRHR